MDSIFEININDLEKEIPIYSVGTLLVCKDEGKIYVHLCTPESKNNPIWTQLTSDYDLEMKFKTQSTLEKVKWLFSNH